MYSKKYKTDIYEELPIYYVTYEEWNPAVPENLGSDWDHRGHDAIPAHWSKGKHTFLSERTRDNAVAKMKARPRQYRKIRVSAGSRWKFSSSTISPQASVDNDTLALLEKCARIAEDHRCGYDCFDEDLDGHTQHNGHCKYDISYEIRRLADEITSKSIKHRS